MKFFQGLHKDNHPSDQPEGTYRDAKNILIDDQRGAVANEKGTKDTSFLPANYKIIGRAPLPDGRIILFSASLGGSGSEIGILQKDDKYKTLVNDNRLNFSLDHPITAIARIVPGRVLSQAVIQPDEEVFSDTVVMGESVETEVDDSPSP